MSKMIQQDISQMRQELSQALLLLTAAQRRADFFCEEDLANTLAQAEDRTAEAIDQLRLR